MNANHPGETRDETVKAKEVGRPVSLSGGDEQREPESQNYILHCCKCVAHGHGRAASERGAAAPDAALPCQRSNNCIEKDNDEYGSPANQLSPYRRKCRHRLIMAIELMVNKYGIDNVGVLTLTFGVPGSGRGSQATRELREQAKHLDFVQKRWHSLNTNIISKRYPDWICVLEPQEDGVWHLHVVVATNLTFAPAPMLKRSRITACRLDAPGQTSAK